LRGKDWGVGGRELPLACLAIAERKFTTRKGKERIGDKRSTKQLLEGRE
jgi:hypothetical protein